MQPDTGIDPLLPTREVCALVNGITRNTLYRWVRDQRFPAPVSIGSRNAYRASEVRAWIDARTKADQRAPGQVAA